MSSTSDRVSDPFRDPTRPHVARRAFTSRTLLSLLLILATVNVLMFAVQRWFFVPLRVPSASMEPNLRNGDRILVQRTWSSTSELAKRIDRGDVLVFRAPEDRHPLVVKRVIGLPGETIQAVDGQIAINNETLLDEKWLPEAERDASSASAQTVDIELTQIDGDEVYVLGDNRDQSIDSRSFGPVRLDDVVGTVAVRFLPFDRFGTVDWE